MKEMSDSKKIAILDWLIFFSIIMLIIMVYLPQKVWEEESKYRSERRARMKHIALAEEFFYELTGEYTTDVNELFSLVEASMDSLIADSTFTGTQNVILNNKNYSINIDASFAERVDTSYSIPEKIKTEFDVTLHQVGFVNENDPSLTDTLWLNDGKLEEVKYSDDFVGIFNTKIERRVFIETDYLRRKFHLENNFIYCPISKNNLKKKKFILSIDESNPKSPIFSIESPIDKNDNELRYGIFRFRPGKKESIVGGVQSWAGE